MATKKTIQVKKHRNKVKEMAIIYKGGGCCLCGYNKTPRALEFHHVDALTKEFSISRKGYKTSWDSIKNEIDKCILLCANCHREVHENLHDQDELKTLLSKTYPKELEDYISNSLVKTTIKVCPVCNKEFTSPESSTVFCSTECRGINRRKITRPSKEELESLIHNVSFLEIGRRYGVSDNAVRKWCKSYDLPYKKSDLKIGIAGLEPSTTAL